MVVIDIAPLLLTAAEFINELSIQQRGRQVINWDERLVEVSAESSAPSDVFCRESAIKRKIIEKI